MWEFFLGLPAGPGSGDDWFQQFRDGKDRGAKDLYNLHYKNLVQYAYKIVKDEEVARDIVSDIIIKAWVQRSIFKDPKHLQNWLYEAVHNACIDWLRANNKEKEFLEELGRLEGAAEAEEGALRLELIKIRVYEQVMEELDRLKSKKFKMYTVLKMSFFEKKTDAEIAEFLKIRKGNVYNIRLRGLRLLKKRLGGDWPLALFFFFVKDIF